MTKIKPLHPLKRSDSPPVIQYDDAKHRYWIDGIEVPSVSAILDNVTAKDALPWWGMRVGLAGVLQLIQDNIVSWPMLQNEVYAEHLSGIPDKSRAKWRGRGKNRKPKTLLEYHMLEAGLTTNQIKDDAGDRGTSVHEAVEQIGTHDVIPDIGQFPEEQQGYVQAVARWWINLEPEFHRQEVIVASRKHAYAGRFDLDATLKGYGRCLVDFKTSKGVYDQHFEQLRLYQVAEEELSVFEPEDKRVEFDHLMVVHLRPDGEYEPFLDADSVSAKTAIAAAHLYHERQADKARKLAKQPA